MRGTTPGYGQGMQMTSTDLLHRASDLGQSASSFASHVVDTITDHGSSAIDGAGRIAGDVSEVIVDAVDRVSRVLPGAKKRRWPVLPVALVVAAVAGVFVIRRKRRAKASATPSTRRFTPTTTGATSAANGQRFAAEHASGLA